MQQKPLSIIQALKNNIHQVIVGKDDVVELILISLLCKGHVLIEDVPGVGKTTLASALAKSLDCTFKRIQFTPDVMPSDVTGYTAINLKSGDMEYKPGAVMSQIVLADEINRTSPKTQSALLEVMEEFQVTVDGITYKLPQPFMVLATQNPVEFVGTYPLPEAQLDRFFMKVSIGYPSVEEEMDVLEKYSGQIKPLQQLIPVCSAEDIISLQSAVGGVYCSREVRSYVAQLAAQTRTHPSLRLGASTRAAIALIRASQANALLDSRDFILPEDVQSMILPVFSHRISLTPEARMNSQTAEGVLIEILKSVAVPTRREMQSEAPVTRRMK